MREACSCFCVAEAPVNDGLKQYLVIRSAFADLCPDAFRILSEADNAKHSNYQVESFMQTMHNVHRRISKRRKRKRKQTQIQHQSITPT